MMDMPLMAARFKESNSLRPLRVSGELDEKVKPEDPASAVKGTEASCDTEQKHIFHSSTRNAGSRTFIHIEVMAPQAQIRYADSLYDVDRDGLALP